MPWSVAIPAVAGLAGAAIGANANKDAAEGAQNASNASTAENRRQYDDTVRRQQPFYDIGLGATGQLSGMSFKPRTLEEITADPSYQYGLKTGMDNLQSTAAAKGGLYSSNALKKLLDHQSDYQGAKQDEAFNRDLSTYTTNQNRLLNLTNVGTGSAAQIGSAGQNMVNNNSNINLSNANAQGAAGIANANIWGNALNQGASSYIDYSRRNTQPIGSQVSYNYDQGSNGAGGYYSNEGRNAPSGVRNDGYGGRAYADGGPVMEMRGGRMEPKIGTRSARPAGGGVMSREAILQALSEQPAPQPQGGMGSLPADPLRNPGGVRALQLQKVEQGLNMGGRVRRSYMSGGDVDGPGGPREDAIPAWLSDGEHVFQADAVRGAGGGDERAGHRKLNALRELLASMG